MMVRPTGLRPMMTASTARASRKAVHVRATMTVIGGSCFQPDAAAAAGTLRIVSNQFDPGCIECCYELHQRVDIAANDAVASFHALDGWQRQAGKVRELALVDTNQ